jgi:hypothetical protein
VAGEEDIAAAMVADSVAEVAGDLAASAAVVVSVVVAAAPIGEHSWQR